MKIYTVQGVHKIDYDFSVEIFNLGCFTDKAKAIAKAKYDFEKSQQLDFAEAIKRYSNKEEYRDVDEGALEIEEDDVNGYYRISFVKSQTYYSTIYTKNKKKPKPNLFRFRF